LNRTISLFLHYFHVAFDRSRFLNGCGSAISSIGAHGPSIRPNITNQSQILIDLHRHTTSSRAVEQLKIATARSHLRGPSKVFRIVNVIRVSCHDSLRGTDSCRPVAVPALTLGLWPPVRSNTETDNDCGRSAIFHQDALGAKAPSQSNNTRREWPVQWKSGRKCEKGS